MGAKRSTRIDPTTHALIEPTAAELKSANAIAASGANGDITSLTALTDITGNLDIAGDVDVTGEFDVSDAAVFADTLTSQGIFYADSISSETAGADFTLGSIANGAGTVGDFLITTGGTPSGAGGTLRLSTGTGSGGKGPTFFGDGIGTLQYFYLDYGSRLRTYGAGGSYYITETPETLTAHRTHTKPDVDGTYAMLSDAESVERVAYTTTDAVTTTVLTIPIATDTTYYLEVTYVAVQDDSAARAAYKLGACIYDDGGTGAALQGATTTIFQRESDGSWTPNITPSGTNVNITVQGDSTNDVNWLVKVEITKLAQ